MPDKVGKYDDYMFPTLGLVYHVALTTLNIVVVTAKDSNASRGGRDHDKVKSLTNT